MSAAVLAADVAAYFFPAAASADPYEVVVQTEFADQVDQYVDSVADVAADFFFHLVPHLHPVSSLLAADAEVEVHADDSRLYYLLDAGLEEQQCSLFSLYPSRPSSSFSSSYDPCGSNYPDLPHHHNRVHLHHPRTREHQHLQYRLQV